MIKILGAAQNNLKSIDVDLPEEKLIVITGVSGSGKSSLAYDTIYAEGQRRYVETFSAYARQFLEQLEKPEVELIEGLSPSISIDQHSGKSNPRSTLGTVTECYDYLRLLYARAGTPFCPHCRVPIEGRSFESILKSINSLPSGRRIQLLSPLVRGKKGQYRELLLDLSSEGFSKVRIDGKIRNLSEEIKLARYKLHDIDLVIDRLVTGPSPGERLDRSLELALHKGNGTVIIELEGEEILFSIHMSCPLCSYSLREITPKMFSFNNPYGACSSCSGTGYRKIIDVSLLIADKKLSISNGAIPLLRSRRPVFLSLLRKIETLGRLFDFSLNTPLEEINKSVLDVILFGGDNKELDLSYRLPEGRGVFQFKSRFEGLINYLEKIYSDDTFKNVHKELEDYTVNLPCLTCNGMRLSSESLSVLLGNKSIGDLSKMSLKALSLFLTSLKLEDSREEIGKVILKEVKRRLDFLLDLGLSYLTMDRAVSTLSGGELRRIRLATQVGSGLVGVLYILDEPTIGLHQRDNERLINTLKELRDVGNTVIVVEHDEQTIRNADCVVDMGPGAGREGGEIVAFGSVKEIMENKKSLTGKYLSKNRKPSYAGEQVVITDKVLKVKGAGEHNLKNINVTFPLGYFICVTGVSGSGKSTLVNDILFKALSNILHHTKLRPGLYSEITGTEYVDKVIMIDQSPIGRTPRSNPVTYTGVLTHIREIFALTPQARLRGYKKGRFSFNVKGGRCEKCLGSGKVHIEMHFLPDVYVQCDECSGKRYNSETLEVKFKEKNIFDVLEMTVSEGLEFFKDFPKVTKILNTLEKVGLSYLQLGQPATLLSGGEAQRIKLASQLSRRATGSTVYILDEPTTGLHFQDTERLLRVLQALRDKGNTIIVIEHNMDVISTSDYIIDLGPEGGDGGGELVACGSPEELLGHPLSYTGKFLSQIS